MAFGQSQFEDDNEVLAEMNLTPMLDVMLVLLIIFIIAIPVINHSVKMDLPRASTELNDTRIPAVNVSIGEDGAVYWDKEAVDEPTLAARLEAAAQAQPQPELHLRADRLTPYEKVAQVMAAAQRSGIEKFGFITSPER